MGGSSGGLLSMCSRRMCSDIFESSSFSGTSLKTKMRSNLERIVTGRAMFSATVR